MKRRQFVQMVSGGGLMLTQKGILRAAPLTPNPQREAAMKSRLKAPLRLKTFEYDGVRLLPGPFADRLAATREFYLAVPEDDTVKGFREKAGLPAPGQHLGGWCGQSSALLFGQWLSGMARIYRATGDTAMRDKAVRLMTEWGKTLPQQTFGHYDYDKFVCGLVDMAQYGDCPEALPLLSRMTDWAIANLKRDRLNASDEDSQGGFFNGQMEWYTLSENLYRAYVLTGDEKYKEFSAVWHYPYYWGMFNGQTKGTPDGFHGYSHANALSSAAMTYAVTGDASYLRTIENAYDFFQKTQCYATGGYGPGEKLMRPNGELGTSVEIEPNAKFLGGEQGRSFEAPCGTWAVFKLGRYLQGFTGQARYGDWTERVLYNGIGAALPIRGRGQTFYYADYRLGGGTKHYFGAPFPCCAGTYIQDVADIHNILYFKSADGLFVNLFVPSEVKWRHGGQDVKVTQTTLYPEDENVRFALQLERPATFALNFRVPEWAKDVSLQINGKPHPAKVKAGDWAVLKRQWRSGDQITLRIPLTLRAVPIDEQHPDRVAYMRGPVVLVRPAGVERPTPDASPTLGMVPFSSVAEGGNYTMYFDPPTDEVALVPVTDPNGTKWRYTTEKPADNWTKADFDEVAWSEGAAPFGTMDFRRTQWNTPEIWLRREVVLPIGAIVNPRLISMHDEDTEVYLNGVLAATLTGYDTRYEKFDITPKAKAQLKAGAPLCIAAHVRQTAGSQLIDVGIIDSRPLPYRKI